MNDIEKAFAIAPQILTELKKAGVDLPSFTLYEDASGTLTLGLEEVVTEAQCRLAVDLVHSQRFRACIDCLNPKTKRCGKKHSIQIDFCGGLLEEAKVRELK